MMLRFCVLGVELWTLTVEHPAPVDVVEQSRKKRPGWLSRARKTTAMAMIR